MNSLSTGCSNTLWTSTSAPARSASFASQRPVACTSRRRPSRCASSAAVRTSAWTRAVSGGWGGMTYQILTPSDLNAAFARTASRTTESLAM